MAYEVVPNGDITLYKNIPLHSDYEHTWYFTDETEQTNKFNEYSHITFLEYSYMRVERNIIKVESPIGSLMGYNYMMFINKSKPNESYQFESRKYYAFIKDIQYVNEYTSRIVYQIDVIQTYAFQYNLEQCFVEREHARTDGLFSNVVNEGFGNLEKVITEYNTDMLFSLAGEDSSEDVDYILVNAYPNNPNVLGNNLYNTDVVPQSMIFSPNISDIGGTPILNQNAYKFRRNSNIIGQKIQDIIEKLTLADYTTVNVKLVPYKIHDICGYTPLDKTSGSGVRLIECEINKNFTFENEISYTPKNKKLYTSAFKEISIISPTDGERSFAPELFALNDVPQPSTDKILKVQFASYLFEIPSPCMCILPINTYNGYIGRSFNTFYVNTLSFDIPFTVDTYSEFIAQQSSSLLARSISHVIKTGYNVGHGINTASQNLPMQKFGMTPQSIAIGGGLGILSEIINTASVFQEKYLASDNIYGQFSALASIMRMGNVGAIICEKNIKPSLAKIIDEYFTMFGYAQKTVKVPTRYNREAFTYVKTANCQLQPISDGLFNDSIEDIQSVYNNGITFWRPNVTIGDYSVSNRPLDDI